MRYPSLSFAFLVAASLVTSACGDDPMTVDRPDATLAPDAPVATPDAAPDATTPTPDAAVDAAPADAEVADAEVPDAGPSGLALPSLGNNGGRASLALGNGTNDLSVLRKQVGLQVTGASPELEVGPAFVTRTYSGSTYIYAFVRVANHGTQRRCFDRIASADYLGAGGQSVAHSTGGFIYGTVGVIDGVGSDACLAPGESSYIPDILQAPYDDVASLSVQFTEGETDWHDPDTSIVPQDIAISGQHLSLNAHNLGPNPATVNVYGVHWFAFDAENQPVAFGFIDPCVDGASPDLAVGANLAMCDNFVFYRGTSTTVQARTPFKPTTSSKLTATSPALRAVAASRAHLRAAFDAAKRR
jgi:hypothetical protein